MRLDTTLLWANSLFFIAYGLAFVFAPEALGQLVTDGVGTRGACASQLERHLLFETPRAF